MQLPGNVAFLPDTPSPLCWGLGRSHDALWGSRERWSKLALVYHSPGAGQLTAYLGPLLDVGRSTERDSYGGRCDHVLVESRKPEILVLALWLQFPNWFSKDRQCHFEAPKPGSSPCHCSFPQCLHQNHFLSGLQALWAWVELQNSQLGKRTIKIELF